MEVIIVDHSDVSVIEITSHHSLSVFVGPVVAVETGWNIRVLSLMTIAWFLELITALHLDTFEERSKDSSRIVSDFIRVVSRVYLLDEIDKSGTELLSCGSIIEIGDKILLQNGRWCVTGHVRHMRGTLESKDWEHVLLGILNVDL